MPFRHHLFSHKLLVLFLCINRVFSFCNYTIKNKNENLEINNLKDPHHELNLYPQLTLFKFMTTEGSFAVNILIATMYCTYVNVGPFCLKTQNIVKSWTVNVEISSSIFCLKNVKHQRLSAEIVFERIMISKLTLNWLFTHLTFYHFISFT